MGNGIRIPLLCGPAWVRLYSMDESAVLQTALSLQTKVIPPRAAIVDEDSEFEITMINNEDLKQGSQGVQP